MVLLWIRLTSLDNIDPGSWGRAFLALSAVLAVLSAFFLILSDFLGGLRLGLQWLSLSFLVLGLWFFRPKVFHYRALILGLGGNRINKLATLRAMLIPLPGIGVGLEDGLGFGVNSFFYKLFETVKFAAALFHLSLN